MKRAPRSRQRHDLYAKYHDYESEISDLLGECGFKAMLGELGYTQASFSRAYRIHIRTVENWVRIGPPDFLAHILTDMLRASIPSPDPETPLDYASKQGAKRALNPSLRSVVDRAVRAGWTRELIASAAIEWFSDEVLTKR